MKKIRYLYILCCFFLSCDRGGFKHNPAKPYPVMEVGDYWIDQFDQRGLQNAMVYARALICVLMQLVKRVVTNRFTSSCRTRILLRVRKA